MIAFAFVAGVFVFGAVLALGIARWPKRTERPAAACVCPKCGAVFVTRLPPAP